MNVLPPNPLIFLAFLVPVFPSLLVAQEQTQAEPIEAKLDSLWIQQPVEKVYLHLDKEQYIPGEVVWFKMYLLEGKYHIPSYLSTVGYVECWNSEDSLIARKTIELTNGQGNGDFLLEEELPGGNYRIRAYSQWMRNSDRAFLQYIKVMDGTETQNSTVLPSGKPDIQFLPESGTFLAGCENQVGIKALGPNGLGIPVKGIIKDARGTELAKFATQHRGMGVVSLSPQKGDNYVAECIWKEDTFLYELPIPENKGIRMKVNSSPFITQVDIHVATGEASPTVNLLGLTRGELNFFVRIKLKQGANQLDIPNSSFPTGVLQLTLLDEMRRPLSERMVWIDRKDQLSINIDPPKKSIGMRAQVEIPLETAFEQGGLTPASISAAIAAEEAYYRRSPFQNSLKAHILLGSEAKGYLESPWEYFHGEEPMDEKIDLLMLTHFWRKIQWEKSLGSTETPPQFLIERGLQVSGKAMKLNGKPYPNAPLYLIIDNFFNIQESQTDEQGEFHFEGLSYNDTSQIVLQIKNEKRKQRPATFELYSPTYPEAPQLQVREEEGAPLQEEITYVQQAQSHLANLKILSGEADYELETVEITGQKTYQEEKYDLKRMYARSDRTLRPDEMGPKTNVIEVLRGNFQGYSLVGGPGNYRFQRRSTSSLPSTVLGSGDPNARREPTFFVDGVLTSMDFVLTIPVENVDFIDIIEAGLRAEAIGQPGNIGVIAIYTKNGIEVPTSNRDRLKGIFKTQGPGYSVTRSFYQPNYLVPDSSQRLPDLRNTLMWEPQLQTDNLGRGMLEFFTGDVPGRYKVVVEGMTSDGKLGYGEAWIEVK